VELEKEAGAVSRSRAQRLLEMAVRTSAAASDPYHENLACTVERRTLEGALASVLGEGGVRHDILRADEDRPIGWDMFTLDYQIQWPLSLVVSRRTFAKYQVIFRHLFQLKRVEYKLAHLWTDYQQARRISRSEPLHRAHLLLQQMMHFVQHVYNYTVFEALEPRWTDLQGRLRSAPTVDQLIGEHENFLDSVLSECLLTRPAILEKIKCLKATCLDFVQLTRKFVTVDAAQAGPTHSLEQSFTARTGPGMMVPISQLEKLKQSTSRPDFGAGVAAFSDAFQGEVSSLIAALQEGAEPHLLNLADQLDFNCYFSNDRSFHY
jgi:gamma-tubulin complex component 2